MLDLGTGAHTKTNEFRLSFLCPFLPPQQTLDSLKYLKQDALSKRMNVRTNLREKYIGVKHEHDFDYDKDKDKYQACVIKLCFNRVKNEHDWDYNTEK